MDERTSSVIAVGLSMVMLPISAFSLGWSMHPTKPVVESVAQVATGSIVKHKLTGEQYVVVSVFENGEVHVVGKGYRDRRVEPISIYACELEPE